MGVELEECQENGLDSRRRTEASEDHTTKNKDEERIRERRERIEIENMKKFAKRVKDILPRGVKVVDVFLIPRLVDLPSDVLGGPTGTIKLSHDLELVVGTYLEPVVQIDLGNGVLLDLVSQCEMGSGNHGIYPIHKILILEAGGGTDLAILGSIEYGQGKFQEALYDAFKTVASKKATCGANP